MSIGIRIGGGIRRALQAAFEGNLKLKEGLWQPPDQVTGVHFKGFSGYDEWIQQCIRASLEAAREIRNMPDDLSEITSIVIYQDPPEDLHLALMKHADAVRALESLCERIADGAAARGCAIGTGLSKEAREQVRRADGTRGRGALLVVALRHVVHEEKMTAEVKLSVSCWGMSSLEEALAVPPRKYTLG